MYCKQCGKPVPVDAKFCANCGGPVNELASAQLIETHPVTVAPSKPKKIWLYIVGIMTFGLYAALFIPAFTGGKINPLSGYYSMFWNGLFFYLLWKMRARKGWHGALLGIAFGVLAFFVAAFISGFMNK